MIRVFYLTANLKMITGNIKLPGDKSISHRAALFSALRQGKSVFTNFNANKDCTATLACLQEMGIEYNLDGDTLTVFGRSFNQWKPAKNKLDAQNSGTTARLISGLLAAQKFQTTLTGDNSLSKRPMNRVIDPLRQMGADIESNNGYLPVTFSPVKHLSAISYKLPVASAQVKSAVLLAGLFSEGTTKVLETVVTRDHTERMLNLKKEQDGDFNIISSNANAEIPDLSMQIPGDFSSAAFFIVAALTNPNSQLQISGVSLNPTRTGLLSALKEMGAEFQIKEKQSFPEPCGDIEILNNTLKNITVSHEIIPNIIDEIPVLAVLATQAEGEFIIRNARELRFKESDRIKSIVENLRNVGVTAKEYDDGFSIVGPQVIKGGKVQTHGDHRIAMAFTIANLIAKNSIEIDNPECASVSFPAFYQILKSIVH